MPRPELKSARRRLEALGRTLFTWKRNQWRGIGDTVVCGILLTIVSIAVLTSCGTGIDPGLASRGEFETYFQRYLVYAQEHNVAIDGAQALRIEFSTLRTSEIGRCESGFLQGRIVYIDEARWKTMNDGSREALILHELGHCLLDRGHRNDKFPDDDETMPGAQKSLMYPYATSGYRYQTHKKYYLDELFEPQEMRAVDVHGNFQSDEPCAGCHEAPEAALSRAQ